jgi:hypothetical protein
VVVDGAKEISVALDPDDDAVLLAVVGALATARNSSAERTVSLSAWRSTRVAAATP